jgi:ketosteroid isomerase-like protein
MSADHIATVRHGYETFNCGDIDAALEMFDPEIEWHTYIVPGPGGGVYRGHDGVRELWSEAKKIFGGFRNEPEEMFDAGDQIVAFVRVEGVGAKSGVAVQARIAHLHTFRGGKVLRVESFEDRDAALRAAGISGAEPC